MFQISSLLTVLLAVSARGGVDINLLQEENRLLAGIDNVQEEKAIQYKSAGDYTLVNIPWSGATSLAFNDSTAATISTLGNAALLVGGLYLLSGFPSALARSDPFGVQRRFGAPAPPAKMFKPRGEKEQERKRGRKKKVVGRHQRQRGVERRGPGAEERTLPQFSLPETERQLRQPQLPRLPQFRPFQLRMPSLPNLRLPSFPGLGRRPQAPPQNRPRPAAAAAQPSQTSPPAPAPQSARPPPPPPPPPAAPVSQSPRPLPQSSRPAPRPQPSRPATPVQASRPPVVPSGGSIIPPVQEQSAPLRLPNPRPAAPSDFGGAFDTDPFQEFQTADFGNDQSFQDLIAEQFGESFDFKKIK